MKTRRSIVDVCVVFVGVLLSLVVSGLIPLRSLIYHVDTHGAGTSVAGSGALIQLPDEDVGALQRNFQEHGYVVVRSVLPSTLVADLLQEARSVFDQRREADRLPLVAVNAMYSASLEYPELRKFWVTSNISAVVARAANSPALRLLDEVVIVTEPSRMAYDCWHSDWYSFGSVARATQHDAHSLWIALVDVSAQTRGGSVQVCRRQDVPPNCTEKVDFDAEAKQAGQVGLGTSWCEQQLEKNCAIPDFRAGDALVFSADMIHRTQALRDHTFRRYALIGRFVGEKARYQRRRTSFLNHHTYKVRHDMCEHSLRAGDRIEGPCFPRVFPDFDLAELKSERRYVNKWVALAMAHAERLWYGEILPD